ncbi:MAG TPA: beta-ketoacyl synthase chain length factor [Myxococcaceae bacterium]|nr:beta-ketoacyl synthase chain length factor [Myxococcaceae bacterium]
MKATVLELGVVAPGAQDPVALRRALAGPSPTALRISTIPEADPKERRLPRLERMALAAARQALPPHCDRRSLAVVYATGYGGLTATVDFLEGIASRGPEFGSPTAFYQSVHHSPAGQLSIALKLHGPSLTISARELSGETALRTALALLKTGRADKVLLVAADERSPSLDNGYRAFGVLSAQRATPSDRWLEPGEGAGALLLGKEPGPLQIDECCLTAHSCPVLRFARPEQFAPLIRKTIAQTEPLSFSLAAPNAEIANAETSILRDVPRLERWSDGGHFGFHGSAGLLRLIAAAVRLRDRPAGAASVVHGLALGGGQAVTVMRHVAR